MKAGDIVRIIGAADGNHSQWDYTPGFNNEWCDGMTDDIGTSSTVRFDSNQYGVELDSGWCYPAQALEVISGPGTWEAMTEDERRQTRTVMATLGGGFVSKLAVAMQAADSENLAKLQVAFPNLPKTYGPGTVPYIQTFGDME